MTHKNYDVHKLDTQTQVFFYEQEFYVLSNFSSFQVRHQGVLHHTSEHAYHYAKFPVGSGAHCDKLRYDIKNAESAHKAFKLGANKALRRRDWEEVKETIMLEILWCKVHQHEYVRQKLLETGDRQLVEDSWRDDVWGWGPNQDGQNRLGICWMTVREAIKNDVNLFPKRPWLSIEELGAIYD